MGVTVSPESPNGCRADLPGINCPSSPFLLSVLRPGLTVNFNTPSSFSQWLSALDSFTVDLDVSDNPGLSKPYDAASEAGSVYLVIGSSQFLLGTFGGGSQGLNAYPAASPLALTESVATADLPAVLAALQSTGFVFAIQVSRTDGDFYVSNAAAITANLEGEAPEPATFGMLGIGLAGLCWVMRRRSN